MDRELTLDGDRVSARCGLGSLGTSSVRTREELVFVGGDAADAEAAFVARDPERRRPRPLTDDERSRLEAGP